MELESVTTPLIATEKHRRSGRAFWLLGFVLFFVGILQSGVLSEKNKSDEIVRQSWPSQTELPEQPLAKEATHGYTHTDDVTAQDLLVRKDVEKILRGEAKIDNVEVQVGAGKRELIPYVMMLNLASRRLFTDDMEQRTTTFLLENMFGNELSAAMEAEKVKMRVHLIGVDGPFPREMAATSFAGPQGGGAKPSTIAIARAIPSADCKTDKHEMPVWDPTTNRFVIRDFGILDDKKQFMLVDVPEGPVLCMADNFGLNRGVDPPPVPISYEPCYIQEGETLHFNPRTKWMIIPQLRCTRQCGADATATAISVLSGVATVAGVAVTAFQGPPGFLLATGLGAAWAGIQAAGTAVPALAATAAVSKGIGTAWSVGSGLNSVSSWVGETTTGHGTSYYIADKIDAAKTFQYASKYFKCQDDMGPIFATYLTNRDNFDYNTGAGWDKGTIWGNVQCTGIYNPESHFCFVLELNKVVQQDKIYKRNADDKIPVELTTENPSCKDSKICRLQRLCQLRIACPRSCQNGMGGMSDSDQCDCKVMEWAGVDAYDIEKNDGSCKVKQVTKHPGGGNLGDGCGESTRLSLGGDPLGPVNENKCKELCAKQDWRVRHCGFHPSTPGSETGECFFWRNCEEHRPPEAGTGNYKIYEHDHFCTLQKVLLKKKGVQKSGSELLIDRWTGQLTKEQKQNDEIMNILESQKEIAMQQTCKSEVTDGNIHIKLAGTSLASQFAKDSDCCKAAPDNFDGYCSDRVFSKRKKGTVKNGMSNRFNWKEYHDSVRCKKDARGNIMKADERKCCQTCTSEDKPYCSERSGNCYADAAVGRNYCLDFASATSQFRRIPTQKLNIDAPANCEVDEDKSGLQCTDACGEVNTISKGEYAQGGTACPPKYKCKPGDGACPDTVQNIACDATPADNSDDADATCGSRWRWRTQNEVPGAEGNAGILTKKQAKCAIKTEEPVRCECLECSTSAH